MSDYDKRECNRLRGQVEELREALRLSLHCLGWHNKKHGVGMDDEACRKAKATLENTK